MTKTWQNYFNIDPSYYAAVTADLIKNGQVKWEKFYPHETFIKLLEKTHAMLSGADSRSLWIEGAYGTGKSHAALTVKSMLEASDDEVRAYFKDYGLKSDLCEQLIADKSNGELVTIHRIGSASIHSDQDLIIAIQDSVVDALRKRGIENKGNASLKDAAVKWLEEKEANKKYFDSLIHEDKYNWAFGGQSVDDVIATLKSSNEEESAKKMSQVLKVAENNGITALRLDVAAMCNWIKSIIQENRISAMLFVWDEFTEFFKNNPNSLTGFQTLVELSESVPFYFLIVTHESGSIIRDKDTRKKILNRFVGDVTIRIEMPENMAFRLMAQAMKTTEDPALKPEWIEYKNELNDQLAGVRSVITTSVKKNATMGQKTQISDAELSSIVPIHPYAALLLKHMSVAFNSNARSMFDFIISNDMTDAKGFKWFISNSGPLSKPNLLTIDMLWDFFIGKDQNGLNDDVRVILDSYSLLKKDSLSKDQARVFKTVLLLEAISTRVGNVELLRPNEQNVDLAFNGTDWNKGKARNIAAQLCEQGLLFEKPVGGGMKEYTVANNGGDKAKIEKLKNETRDETKISELVILGELSSAINLPPALKSRFVIEKVGSANLNQSVIKFNSRSLPFSFKTILTFAQNDEDAASIKSGILKNVKNDSDDIIYIECLTPMGEDAFELYVENMAYSKNYSNSDKQRAMGFSNQATKCLNEWKAKISQGAFTLYSSECKNGIRLANVGNLIEELRKIDLAKFPYSLDQYNMNDYMFQRGQCQAGAKLGLRQEIQGAFSGSGDKLISNNILKGAWKVDRYWENPALQNLPIVKIKKCVDKAIADGFKQNSGRVSILEIFTKLCEAPYGLIPCNAAAFVMGFVLKEYATSDYFWSSVSTTLPMTDEKMSGMINEAISQSAMPSPKFKNEYLVEMSLKQRAFLQCSATVFHIPSEQCGSIEAARGQIRIKMMGLTFPIWCIKSILSSLSVKNDKEIISSIIDDYCSIANLSNSNKESESGLAEKIGGILLEIPSIVDDLVFIVNNDNCRNGMLAYIDSFEGGELRKVAAKIGDNGAYLDQVKQKFDADAANWVWKPETANEKISDVIIEYKIVAESNKFLIKSSSLKECIVEWQKYTNNIRIPYDVLRKYCGNLTSLLSALNVIKQTGDLPEQNKKSFLNDLQTQIDAFDELYKNQLLYFKDCASSFIEGMDENELSDFYKSIPLGQFTKSSTEYYQFIQKSVEEFKKTQKKKILKDLWFDKTATKDPKTWSDKFTTPVLCMVGDAVRSEAKAAFDTLLAYSSPDSDIERAIEFLRNASFFDKLDNPQERDKCFNERVIGEYSILLDNVDEVRKELLGSVSVPVYDWMDNGIVRNKLQALADKKYKVVGCQKVQQLVEKLNPNEIRAYLVDLVSENFKVGMEILKKSQKG